MNAINGQLIKALREELNLSQEEFAEKISASVSTVHRLENNKTDIDVFEFMDILNIFGKSLEDYLLLFMGNEAHQEYMMYHQKLQSYFYSMRYGDFIDSMAELQESGLMQTPYVQQMLAYAKICKTVIDREGHQLIVGQEDIEALHQAMRITIKDFDEEKVSEYLLTTLEIYIIYHISKAYSRMEQHEKAIKLAKDLLHNKTFKNAAFFNNPLASIRFAQSSLLEAYFQAEMYDEFLRYAHECSAYQLKAGELFNLATILGHVAAGYKFTNEDEVYYKTQHIRACCLQFIQGFYPLSALEEITESTYGVKLEDWMSFLYE